MLKTEWVRYGDVRWRDDGKDGEEEDKDDDYRELYDECYKEVERMDAKILF